MFLSIQQQNNDLSKFGGYIYSLFIDWLTLDIRGASGVYVCLLAASLTTWAIFV